MPKIQPKKYYALLSVLIIILFVAIFMVSRQEVIVSATHTNGEIDTLKETTTSLKSQSFFNPEEGNLFILQAFKPMTDPNDKIIFAMKVFNTYSEYVTLSAVDVYRNNIYQYTRRFDAPLNTGQMFEYKTDSIDLGGGTLGVRNEIKAIFSLKGASRSYTQEFVYYYIPLRQCETNSDCVGLRQILCDKDNKAGFSKVYGEHYCVQICTAHADCPTGQICKTGVCG